MKVLFEGQKYDIKVLKKYFGDKFYHQNNNNTGTINVVGYFHSNQFGLFYFIPKVFIDDNNNFLGRINFLDLLEEDIEKAIDDLNLLNWLRKFLILFYKSLVEYKNRIQSGIIDVGDTLQLSTSVGDKEYTFLDLTLSIANFYKKNRNMVLFHQKKLLSEKHRKTSWSKTVEKQSGYFIDDETPIYNVTINKLKTIDPDEILLVYFYSVLYHLKDEYKIDLPIDCPYKIIKGKNFEKLLDNGLFKLKKIRHNYFSDTLKKVYNLLELFFSKTNKGSVSRENQDFIIVRSYHSVFEDMVDKLISDKISETKTFDGKSLKYLKKNKDGKNIDHIFPYDGLIDNDEKVFYIGDSKYYKYNSPLDNKSIYKQFTYAKNVIQFNIDLLNENKAISFEDGSKARYRDQVTEGYNITPNFFIQGRVYDLFDFTNSQLELDKESGVEMNSHFKNRLFDRDTLFVNYYKINFLYVLYAYVNFSSARLNFERSKIYKQFKENFVDFFNASSHFQLYKYDFASNQELEMFIENEFRRVIGKIYQPRTNTEHSLIFGVGRNDIEVKDYFETIHDSSRKVTEHIYTCKNGMRIYFEKYRLE